MDANALRDRRADTLRHIQVAEEIPERKGACPPARGNQTERERLIKRSDTTNPMPKSGSQLLLGQCFHSARPLPLRAEKEIWLN